MRDGLEMLMVTLPILVFGFLLIAIIAFPINRIETMSIESQRNALQQAFDYSRKHNDKLETAAIANTVANFNSDLAVMQYYASWPVVGWWYSSKVLETKPIK